MSGNHDSRESLLADLQRYLQQKQEHGDEWYLDAGPVQENSPLATAAVTPPEDPARTTESPPSSTTPGRILDAAVVPPPRDVISTPPPSPREAFQTECDTFVQQTLELIQKASRPQASQQDIFAAAEPTHQILDREQKKSALAELAAEVAPCRQCKLHTGRTQTVFGVGDPDADLVFIGEAPGRDEDLQGEPFVGRAGKLLTEILQAIGFGRDDVYICNILKCRPPQNRDPEREEVDACEPYLKRQLEILEPRVICCLGRVAAQTLLGKRSTLTAMREDIHFYAGIPVMVTFHPAALLRNPHWKRPTWDDVRKLRALHDALRS